MARVLTLDLLGDIERLCRRYPTRSAALLPSLQRVQDVHGFVSHQAQLDIAEILDVPPTQVGEVMSFYTMLYSQPRGRHVVKICRNLACQLRGADRILERAQALLGVAWGQTTSDGRITLEQEECLASCGTGPMLWCNHRLVENLTEEKLEAFLASLP